MPDNENEKLNAEESVSEKKKGKSFMEVYREINEKEKAEEIKRQSELEAARADRERKARDEYAEKLRQEKLELLKLKQGVISEEDIPTEIKVERHYTVREKIGNFFYHNKMYIIIGTITVLLIGFLLYDLLSRVQPDVAIMFIADDYTVSLKTDMIEEALLPFCKDYNGDGKVDVRVSYVPAAGEIRDDSGMNSFALQELQANQTKLLAEFQSADTIIIIADDKAIEEIGGAGDLFADMEELFPGDENADGYKYMLKGTSIAEDIEYPGLSEELFAVFRTPREGLGVNMKKFERNYNGAVEMWTDYVNQSQTSE